MKNESMTELDKLYSFCKNEIGLHHDALYDDSCFKFDFAFALLAFCSDWHGGQNSDLYALQSALSLEWEFEPNMAWYDEEEIAQFEVYQWLEEKFEVKK